MAKKFPKALKDLPTFKLLENKLFNFKESLPLVVSLKYDAMKSRHWQELMNVTGVTFDISLKTLTLNNIFAMELHKYSTTVEGIINQAVQEGKIENDLVKIDMAWRENCLSVVKYKKDGVERGLILRSAEELKIGMYHEMCSSPLFDFILFCTVLPTAFIFALYFIFFILLFGFFNNICVISEFSSCHLTRHIILFKYADTFSPLFNLNDTEIEDNVLNLQTIAGSRYVSTFVDRVRHWERILNMVSECLEAWFIVQRKWAYLEGIFIGIILMTLLFCFKVCIVCN